MVKNHNTKINKISVVLDSNAISHDEEKESLKYRKSFKNNMWYILKSIFLINFSYNDEFTFNFKYKKQLIFYSIMIPIVIILPFLINIITQL